MMHIYIYINEVFILRVSLKQNYVFFKWRSSKTIHALVLRNVLSASIPFFFDTHTVGEILNRFSKDCETMDINLPGSYYF